MGKNIKLQKFSRILLVTMIFSTFGIVNAESLNDAKLPSFQNIGILPVQWGANEWNSVKFEQLDKKVNTIFKNAVIESYRFRVLDNELVKIAWSNKKERDELVSQFELDGFVYLEAISKNDEVIVEVKLVDTSLKLLLLEREVMDKGYFEVATESEFSDRISKLTYSLLNRLAYDANVTSVQGAYVTLSAGSKQGINRGDEFEFLRSFLSDVHPANGTWLAYKTVKLGKGTVVESKEYASVVKVISMIKDNVIEAGDGVKNFNAPHRKAFRVSIETENKAEEGSENLVLYPLYENDQKDQPKLTEQEDKKVDEKPVEQIVESKPQQEVAKEEPQSSNDVMKFIRSFASYGTLSLGLDSWKAKDGAEAESKLFSGLILNTLTATAGNNYSGNFYYDTKVSLGYGQTDDGSFSKIFLNGSLFYKMSSDVDPNFYYRGGIGVNLSTFAVNDETFGGWDLVYFNMFVGLGGRDIVLDNRKVDWSFTLALVPASFGRVGGHDKMNTVNSAFGYNLGFQAYFINESEGPDWGLGFEYSNLDLGYKKDDLKYSGMTITAGMRTSI